MKLPILILEVLILNTDKLLLYAVTDRSYLNGKPLSKAVEEAILGGATMIQLREKELDLENFIKTAAEIKKICSKYMVPLIINDNVQVCTSVDADGVHLGQGDMPLEKARELLGKDKIIGITAKTIEQAKSAELDGADYIGCGAVFGTVTKNDAKKMELSTLKAICNSVSIPVVAIGGVSADNVELLRDSGISGAAVVSGIFASQDIRKAAQYLSERLRNIVK